MSDTNQNDVLNFPESKKLPGMLNVLTILTFIGSGLALLLTLGSSWLMSFSKKIMDNAEGMELPPDKMAEIEKGRKAIEMFEANKYPIIISGLIGIALCVYGAMQMRKLKKEGFYIYTIGELLPLIIGAFLMGFSVQYSSTSSYVTNLGLPLLFVILYATQLKYMKK